MTASPLPPIRPEDRMTPTELWIARILLVTILVGMTAAAYWFLGIPSNRITAIQKIMAMIVLLIVAFPISVILHNEPKFEGWIDLGITVAATWTVLSERLFTSRIANVLVIVAAIYATSKTIKKYPGFK